jgi:ribonuclease G
MTVDTLVYEKNGREVRLAALEDGKLTEFGVFNEERAAEGNVYLGKITKKIELSNGHTGFMVQIGAGEEAFMNAYEPDQKEPNMSEGQSVVVQVAQEAHAEKGAKVVRQIQIVGTTVVYRPFRIGVEVSSKIEDQTLAQQYRTAVWENVTGQEGWAVRTAAVEFPIEDVLEEMVKLRRIYDDIRMKARTANAPALLYVRENPLYEMIRRFQDNLKKIVVNNHHLEDEIKDSGGEEFVEFQAKPFEAYGLEDQLVEALDRTVFLNGGGRLHIEQTRLGVCFDVDSGDLKFGGAVSRLNEAAALEIARQIRLKNLSGKILIDFAGSSEYRFIRPVIDLLETALADDPCRGRVLGLSKAGNVEIVRQRRRPSLLDIYTEECPTCHGAGRVER